MVRAPPGDFPYISSDLQTQVDFLLLLLVVRCMHGLKQFDAALFSTANTLEFQRCKVKNGVPSIGAIVRSMRLNFYPTDPGTVAANRVMQESGGNKFQNCYLLTVMSTATFAMHLRERLCCNFAPIRIRSFPLKNLSYFTAFVRSGGHRMDKIVNKMQAIFAKFKRTHPRAYLTTHFRPQSTTRGMLAKKCPSVIIFHFTCRPH